jgi:hypothetical protein
VDQVSKPYLVAVAVLVLFAGMWFTVLRPKEPAAEAPLPTAPGMTGLNRAVGSAKGATAASARSADAKNAAAASASSEPVGASSKPNTPSEATAGAPGTAKGAKPDTGGLAPVEKQDPSRFILDDLKHGRTAALLFYDGHGSDDRSVLRELKAVNRHHGKVTVHVARIGRVGEFEAITRGVRVLTSPTILVIGADRKARTITGFTVTSEIDQLVSDVAGFGGRAAGAAKRP